MSDYQISQRHVWKHACICKQCCIGPGDLSACTWMIFLCSTQGRMHGNTGFKTLASVQHLLEHLPQGFTVEVQGEHSCRGQVSISVVRRLLQYFHRTILQGFADALSSQGGLIILQQCRDSRKTELLL